MHKKHSTQIGHIAHCKCADCRHARSMNRKYNTVGHFQRIPATAVKRHIENLLETTGLPLETLARSSTVSAMTWRDVLDGSRKNMLPVHADAILSVTAENAVRNRYPSKHYQWRLGVLNAQGYPTNYLEAAVGARLKMGYANDKWDNVAAEKWDRLETAWATFKDRLASTEEDGIPNRIIRITSTCARKNGYHPLAAYDNEFDPEPADTSDAYQLIRDDFAAVADMVETRVRAGLDRADIKAELSSLFPDVRAWNNIVERVQKRVSRDNARTEKVA